MCRFPIRVGEGEKAIIGRRRKSADGVWVRGCCDRLQELHIRDIIEIYLVLKSDDESFSVEAYGQHRGGERELAYRGVTLHVIDLQAARGGDQGDKGRREKHLAKRDVSTIRRVAF